MKRSGHLERDAVTGERGTVLVERRHVVRVTEPGRLVEADEAVQVEVAFAGQVDDDLVECVDRLGGGDLVRELVGELTGGDLVDEGPGERPLQHGTRDGMDARLVGGGLLGGGHARVVGEVVQVGRVGRVEVEQGVIRLRGLADRGEAGLGRGQPGDWPSNEDNVAWRCLRFVEPMGRRQHTRHA
ncbi:MAG TPA: hypothetical protein VGG05_25250 [Pseudonocardiaceae bacterium]